MPASSASRRQGSREKLTPYSARDLALRDLARAMEGRVTMSSGWGNYPSEPGYQPAPGQPAYPAPPGQPGYPPPPGQAPYPAPPPPSKRPGWLVPAIIGIIAVVVVGGFFLFRDRISNDVASLEPGQCFDTPTDDQSEVSDVQRQPCNEPHDAEVFANFVHPAPAGEA